MHAPWSAAECVACAHSRRSGEVKSILNAGVCTCGTHTHARYRSYPPCMHACIHAPPHTARCTCMPAPPPESDRSRASTDFQGLSARCPSRLPSAPHAHVGHAPGEAMSNGAEERGRGGRGGRGEEEEGTPAGLGVWPSGVRAVHMRPSSALRPHPRPRARSRTPTRARLSNTSVRYPRG